MSKAATGKALQIAAVVVTSLFFTWGFITVLVDSLIPRLREVFELTYFQSGLVQFAFFIAYGLISIPAGALLSRIGYKRGMVLGLLVMGFGCMLFWPAAGWRVFPLFLLGYFILAAGMTVLQVAANPYIAVLGPERSASTRLNLAQAFNSLGTTIAPLVGASLILSDRIKTSVDIDALSATEQTEYLITEAQAVQTPFAFLAGALVLLAVIVLLIKLPVILGEKRPGGYSEAFGKKRLIFGALGIFLYVGAEVAIGSYLVNYFLDMNMADAIKNNAFMSNISSTLLGKELAGVNAKGIVGAFVALYWGGAMIGRFVGAWLTNVFRPYRVLVIFSFCAIALILISMNTSGFVAMWSILAVGLFNSIMFPTIFTLSIEGLGELKPQGSGILCTAIAGGAFIPPALGFLADNVGFKLAFILLLLCYGYITFFAARIAGRPSAA